jgi:ADP-ribosyl-[dinitrogen reductase] hydrolase
MNRTDSRERGSRRERAAGAILGMASGDALGAGYEFGPPLPAGTPVSMDGGRRGPWAPGEWTDDTSMAIPILRVLAAGRPLEGDALDEIVAAWIDWSKTAKDVGIQTRQVFATATARTADAVLAASRRFAATHDRAGGNGSLMRTAPVALGYLEDGEEDELVRVARLLSDLTHADPHAGDACVLWSLAIRHGIRTGELDLRSGLQHLPADRATYWTDRLDEAEAHEPDHFTRNGWVVEALQGAWSAITHGSTLVDVLERAVRGGRDADTVAAIAGGLAGAVHGASALPAHWRRILHGWPGLVADDLSRAAVLAARRGEPADTGWPAADRFQPLDRATLVRHPHDEGVWLGSLKALDDLPPEIDAVVSLCRVGAKQTDREQVEFWLIDEDGRNPNLDFILRDAADTVAALRAEGRTVFLHCFEGVSRTPSVGAAYSVLHRGRSADVALREVTAALPMGNPQSFLQAGVRRLQVGPE